MNAVRKTPSLVVSYWEACREMRRVTKVIKDLAAMGLKVPPDISLDYHNALEHLNALAENGAAERAAQFEEVTGLTWEHGLNAGREGKK